MKALKGGSRHSGAGLNRFAARGSKSLNTLKTAALAAGTIGFAGLGIAVKESIDAFRESQKVQNQTLSVLKSTHHQAGLTSKAISDLATAVSKKAGIDDEAIQSAENLLLTFTNIRNEAGK